MEGRKATHIQVTNTLLESQTPKVEQVNSCLSQISYGFDFYPIFRMVKIKIT